MIKFITLVSKTDPNEFMEEVTKNTELLQKKYEVDIQFSNTKNEYAALIIARK